MVVENSGRIEAKDMTVCSICDEKFGATQERRVFVFDGQKVAFCVAHGRDEAVLFLELLDEQAQQDRIDSRKNAKRVEEYVDFDAPAEVTAAEAYSVPMVTHEPAPVRRGRKPGSQNRPKDVIAAEKAAKIARGPQKRGRKKKVG